MLQRIKEYFDRKLRQRALRGNSVVCPCCKGHFLTFLPGGVVTKRPHALCPGCGSLERHRLLWHFVQHKTTLLSKPHKVLHVAPEPLFFQLFSQNPGIDYVPCAKFGEGYEDEYPVGTINIDLTDIDFPDETFDVILCSHVLEHIPNDQQAMRELHRVLKPTGWAILQVPLDLSREKTYEDFSITRLEAREKAFGQRDHVRVYGRDYPARLAQAGFAVQAHEATLMYSQQEIFRYGFDKYESVFYCQK